MNNFYPDTGTTLCPHCGTRFKIAKTLLEEHHGMVRCGHCLHAFDPRPHFAPDEIDPQLELPIIYQSEESAEQTLAAESAPDVTDTTGDTTVKLMPLANQPSLKPEVSDEFLFKRSYRLWAIAAIPLMLLLLAQAAYLFRVELAAHQPTLKPALLRSCEMLNCSVPLPQKINLMSIESSELQSEPAHKNQIQLVALLRNRANHTQAFPDLELTLTDNQDSPLARRIFKPEDYVEKSQNFAAGLAADQELNILLRLDTTDLKPVGYRLGLFYSGQQ